MLNNLGILDRGRNRLERAQRESEEALKIYRELAQKKPETYLPRVAMMLNSLATLRDTGRIKEARKEYEEALKIYRELAQKEPNIYLPYLTWRRR
jgi:nephrocystin-3